MAIHGRLSLLLTLLLVAFRPVEAASVILHASKAEVHGKRLRYEPEPKKNTLGYWTVVEDWASWDFEVAKAGRYSVEALVGCGNGSGGSEVEFRVDGQVLVLKVPETGGFQAFVPMLLGTVKLEAAGKHRLEVRPRSKPGLAVMDLRQVTLAPAVAHGFLATGGETYILDDDGKVVWRFPLGTRDGWMLPDGHVLLAVNKGPGFPGGGVVETDREGKELFKVQGTQSEVNTVQPLGDGGILYTEAGDHPRIMEVDREGKVRAEVPIRAQTRDHHLQTRMTRKLPNGHYLVPQLLDKVVREYDAKGEVVWEVKTPDMPFTAVRLAGGNTLIACTRGNLVIEVDAAGKTVWSLTNDDLPGRPIHDACGLQRLPNGNTVIANYGAPADGLRAFEVTREKAIVWFYRNARVPGVHQIQVLDTDGQVVAGPPLR